MRALPLSIKPVLVLCWLVLLPICAGATPITIIGEVNDSFQLVASEDGQLYQIGDTPAGNEMGTKAISLRVKVVGDLVKQVVDGEEQLVIMVSSYEPIDDGA